MAKILRYARGGSFVKSLGFYAPGASRFKMKKGKSENLSPAQLAARSHIRKLPFLRGGKADEHIRDGGTARLEIFPAFLRCRMRRIAAAGVEVGCAPRPRRPDAFLIER